MPRYWKPQYLLALFGLATFGLAPVLAQDEFRPDPPRAAIENPNAPTGDLSATVPSVRVPVTTPATTPRAVVAPRVNSATTILRPPALIDSDPADTAATTDPVIGPAQQRARTLPRITRYNPRLVPGVRGLRAPVQQADEGVATPGLRVLPIRSHLIGSEQSGPYHRDRYLFYERDRRFNPSPYPGGGGNYNLVW
ncbi:MAG: hypothetical protein IT428_12420 [Planctomycetaceae bacterium]|nr:hypothetical protein [Planctomycetaceae bacterium]